MKKLKLGLLSAVAVATVTLTVNALVPTYGYHRTYYSDANWTQVVGEAVLTCGSGLTTWGSTTEFVEVDSWEC